MNQFLHKIFHFSPVCPCPLCHTVTLLHCHTVTTSHSVTLFINGFIILIKTNRVWLLNFSFSVFLLKLCKGREMESKFRRYASQIKLWSLIQNLTTKLKNKIRLIQNQTSKSVSDHDLITILIKLDQFLIKIDDFQ